jgi:hypothetical protein
MREALPDRRAGVGGDKALLSGRSGVVQVRNPKAEGRKKPEIRNPNLATCTNAKKCGQEH